MQKKNAKNFFRKRFLKSIYTDLAKFMLRLQHSAFFCVGKTAHFLLFSVFKLVFFAGCMVIVYDTLCPPKNYFFATATICAVLAPEVTLT